jgi:6-phosphogluconolactonase
LSRAIAGRPGFFQVLIFDHFVEELRMLRKAGALLLVCASMGASVGCNFFSSNSNQYVYAAIPASDEILAYREDPNSGVLTELAASPITAGPEVQSLVFHPSGKYIYAANPGQNNVSQFTVNSDGSLTEYTTRANAGSGPNLVAMDPAGAYLYVANSGSTDISVFSITSGTGVLQPVGQSLGGGVGFAPMNMVVSPSGAFLYVTGQSVLGGQVEAFPLSSGQLGFPVSTGTGNNPFGLVINSAGTYLYTGNKADSTISEFQINSDGSLTALPGSPFSYIYQNPLALLIDKSGSYLYAADEGSANLAAFTIGSDGGLTALTSGASFATSSEPNFIATDSGGNFLFVGNQSTSPAVESFSLDKSDGTLTEVYTYKVVSTPTSIVTTP